ncbi:MAG TPA: type II toxin-antitoxin system VapC family toxin [Xanthobacteraceae bacterium]|jgi:tRNA(fMet)-specific endonuclease VapC|nr:type II toxin-antitoxin system VapC family toxin [Xanthobacteraceae bacterium]
MAFLLDTNIVSDLVRDPKGRVADRVARIGPQNICTSIIVAAELRYGAIKRAWTKLSVQLEAVLGSIEILPLGPPVDVVYGRLRAALEKAGRPIGANDLLIAAHALALHHTLISDNEGEFSRIDGLSVENWLR